ncbi:Thioesterase-like superfamily protein [Microbacterium sp. cf046]|uniref:thioesterase family protein n=1 Tax=Microbacterium sp. cf046 TaxID=1761803 RepID=UPI0008EE0E5C|nr:thioesterase family protein [Microbacterium sp. cf046]SFR91727.1 Thioesterase-like superfamily protein [Microbacterium sp. cf046]
MTAYFERLDRASFRATPAVQGAWNTAEQHVAPALGLLTHCVELDRDSRRVDDLRVARLSFDILGTLPIGVVDLDVRVLRAGRTIELVGATLSHNGRAAVVLRAWLLAPGDTASIAGGDFPTIPAPDDLESWHAEGLWPGEFVRTVDARRAETAPGRAQFWLRPGVPLLNGEPISSTARALSILDIANGIAPRHPPTAVAFPNLDTTVHLFTEPRGEWLGFDTTVTFGTNGIGLTHSVLHDEHGPIGTMQQILTLRPRA